MSRRLNFNLKFIIKILYFCFFLIISSTGLKAKELYPVVYNGNVAYIDNTGKLIINQELETPYEDGEIDMYGKKYQTYLFPDWAYFSEGKATFLQTWGFWFIRIGKEFGVLDTNGNVLIKPQDNIIWSFKNNKAKTVILLKSFDYTYGEQFTFIDETSINKKEVVYNENFPEFDYCGDFSEGFAVVLIGDSLQIGRSGKFNYVNLKGELISQNGFDDVKTFSDGFGVVMMDSLWGIIDSQGNFTCKPKYYMLWNLKNGLARYFDGKNYGFVNKFGEKQFSQMFATANDFSEGFAKVQIQENEFNFIDMNGNFLTPNFISKRQLSMGKGFAAAGNFSSGLAPVMIDGLWGYINTKGELVIPNLYSFAQDFRNGFAQVWKDNKMHIINSKGEIIWTYEF